jgi:hypothetical protein
MEDLWKAIAKAKFYFHFFDGENDHSLGYVRET